MKVWSIIILQLLLMLPPLHASIECESVYRRHTNARACLLYNLKNCKTTNIFKQPGKQCLTAIIQSNRCHKYFNCSIQSNSSEDISTTTIIVVALTYPYPLLTQTYPVAQALPPPYPQIPLTPCIQLFRI